MKSETIHQMTAAFESHDSRNHFVGVGKMVDLRASVPCTETSAPKSRKKSGKLED